MSVGFIEKSRRYVAVFIVLALFNGFLVSAEPAQAASSDSLDVFLKNMKDADTALNQADQYYSKNKNRISDGWSESTQKIRDTFISLLEKGENSLTAALKSKYSFNTKYTALFNKLKIYNATITLHDDGSGVDFVRTFVSENYGCYSVGCQGAPISYIMQVKYKDGRTDVFTTHGEIYGEDTSNIIDLRVVNFYGFFKNKKNETIMMIEQSDWRGGGWSTKLWNSSKKKEDKLADYIPAAGLSLVKSNQIDDFDEATRTLTFGKKKVKLKNVSTAAIKPNLKKKNLSAVMQAAKRGTFPNIKITLESSFDEAKKVYGPLDRFEGGTYFLKSFNLVAEDNGNLSEISINPKEAGLASLTLTELEGLLQVAAVKDIYSWYYLEYQAGQYTLTFSGRSLNKSVSGISISHR